jgi:catechol 2,3-dioxygenase
LIWRLGHAELFVRDLSHARDFYVGVLGFIEAAADSSHIFLRGADELETHTLTLTAGSGPGLGHISFRVADPESLDALAKLHAELGIPTTIAPPGLEPGQGKALRVMAPGGVPVEFYHDFELIEYYDQDGRARLPMRHSHALRGVPPTRIDHANLRFTDLAASYRYWVEQLEFSVSEQLEDDDGSLMTVWIRRKATTHDLALGRFSASACHHIAFLAEDGAHVIRAADLLADAGYRESIEFGPGRHGITNAFFLYVRDPSGNRIEIYANDYWKDLDRPPLRWRRSEFASGGMLWWGGMPPGSFVECGAFNTNWP